MPGTGVSLRLRPANLGAAMNMCSAKNVAVMAIVDSHRNLSQSHSIDHHFTQYVAGQSIEHAIWTRGDFANFFRLSKPFAPLSNIITEGRNGVLGSVQIIQVEILSVTPQQFGSRYINLHASLYLNWAECTKWMTGSAWRRKRGSFI